MPGRSSVNLGFEMTSMIREKVKTGLTGLDEMLMGGLIPGRPYVVSGTPGTGKTTLAMQFLLEGVRRGENVLFVCIDEPPNEVKANMAQFGWNLSKVRVFDATQDVMSYDRTPVRDVSTERRVVYLSEVGEGIRRTSEKGPADMTIHTLQELLKQEMRSRRYSRAVVDSVTSLRRLYVRTSDEYAVLQSFFRVLSDMGVTAMVTVQSPEAFKLDAESQLARGEIRLHKWFDGRGLLRGVSIEKYRGSPHDIKMRPMKITSNGIEVKTEPAKMSAKDDEGQALLEDTGQEESVTGPEPIPEQPSPSSPVPAPPPPAPEDLPPPPDDENGGASR